MESFLAARFPYLSAQREADKSVAAAVRGTEVSDEHLLSRLRMADGEALGLLFRRYARLVRHIALRILRDDTEAEDLVQDLFLFLQRKGSVFDSSKSSASSWIVQMTYHRAIERRRYLATRQFYARGDLKSSPDRLVGTPTAENDYSAEEVFGRNGLAKVVDTLSQDQRETLRLYFFEGYSLAEIGQRLGQNLGNVRNHYYRGLDKLRKAMLGGSLPATKR